MRETRHLSNKSSRRIDIFSFALPREHAFVGIMWDGRVRMQPAKAWHRSASPNLHGLARAAVLGFGQDEPRSFKSLRRLAKFRDARDSCRANAPQRRREQHTEWTSAMGRAWKLAGLPGRFLSQLRILQNSTRQRAVLFSHTEPLRSHTLLPSTNAFTGFQGTKGPHISPLWWPSGIFDPK